jgi:intracellular septation protein A
VTEIAAPEDDLAALRTDRSHGRGIEARAFLHSVRPLATDLAATFAFYVLLAVTGNVAVATEIGIALGIAQAGWMLWRGVPIAAMQWTSLVLVIVMGGLTLITHDPRFVLIKVSIFYFAIGATMLRPGWMRRYIPPIAIARVPPGRVRLFELLWAALILGTGAINLWLTFTVPAVSVARFMTIWAPSSKIVLFAVQYALFRSATRRAIIAELRSGA